MKICLQSTLVTPGDRIEIDSANWAALPKRPQPIGGEILDDQPGWYHEVCIQGISSTGDHHAVRDIGDDCELTSWSDDPEDEAGHPDFDPVEPREWWFHASVIRFRPLAPDTALGGAINTNITRTVYGGQRFIDDWNVRLGPVKGTILKPWAEFVPPPEDTVRHGIWTPDALHDLHVAKRSQIGWRDWGEHLDSKELDPRTGRVLTQYSQGRMSPPKGTLTQFLRDTARPTAAHLINPSSNELAMAATAGAGETLNSGNLAAGTNLETFAWTSDIGFPNDSDWPSGLYECQTDCTAIDTNVTYGLLTLGGASGHFASIINSTTTHNETWQQTQTAFNASGLNMASQTIDPASGLATDRFECMIAGARSAGCHGNRIFTLQFTSDAFARGPWTAAAGLDIPIAAYHHFHHNMD